MRHGKQQSEEKKTLLTINLLSAPLSLFLTPFLWLCLLFLWHAAPLLAALENVSPIDWQRMKGGRRRKFGWREEGDGGMGGRSMFMIFADTVFVSSSTFWTGSVTVHETESFHLTGLASNTQCYWEGDEECLSEFASHVFLSLCYKITIIFFLGPNFSFSKARSGPCNLMNVGAVWVVLSFRPQTLPDNIRLLFSYMKYSTNFPQLMKFALCLLIKDWALKQRLPQG